MSEEAEYSLFQHVTDSFDEQRVSLDVHAPTVDLRSMHIKLQ